jgi:hypothetical protein
MPADLTTGELAAIVLELRALAEGLRATAARLSSAPGQGSRDRITERELARRARPEIERAKRRGIDGRIGADLERSGPWHRR